MLRIGNGKICGPNGITTGRDLVVRDGRAFVEELALRPSPAEKTIDAEGSYLVPGFIEIHTHGAGLFEFTMGKYDPAGAAFDNCEACYERELPRYANLRASTGVTNLYLGTWSSPIEQQKYCFRQLKKYMQSSGNGRDGSRIVGGLLEGTFLNPRMAGAQNPKFMAKPDIALFDELNESGVIRLVNVVPDFGEDSYRLTEYLTKHGISVGAGHTDATGNQFRAATAKGLKYCIHFLNGPISGSYKEFNGGGGVEAILSSDLYAEQIVDGMHVSPRYVRDVIARKGIDRIMAVSDAIFVSQAQGVRDFSINGISGRVDDGGRFIYVVGKTPLSLFSSILTMDVAFSNLVSWLTVAMPGAWHAYHEAIPFDKAVAAAVQACSTNIIEMLRKNGGDDLQSGCLADGNWADFSIADITGQPGNYQLDIKQVFVRGEKVWEKPWISPGSTTL